MANVNRGGVRRGRLPVPVAEAAHVLDQLRPSRVPLDLGTEVANVQPDPVAPRVESSFQVAAAMTGIREATWQLTADQERARTTTERVDEIIAELEDLLCGFGIALPASL